MRSLVVLAAVMFAAAAQQASAQHYDVDLESTNAKLNQTYGFLMAHLAPSDQAGLRKSQRLWIAFRDADCAFGFRKLDDKQQCLVARTQVREEQIRSSYYLDAKNHEIAIPMPD
jgi:uncharacterized protein YecT (DUF1311 family)